MGDLKLISHEQFNELIKGKGFKGRNEYKLKELKAKFSFKPMYDRRTLVISSEDMEPTTFDSLRKAVKAIDLTYSTLRYAKDKERDFIKKHEKIYKIKWCLYLSRWISITTSEHNQEATLYLQKLTSAYLIQRLSQVHLLGGT